MRPDTAVETGVREPERDLMRRVLIKKGVPDQAIVTVGKSVSSTYGDICAACDWAKTSGAKRLIIPTDLFHTRRLKWISQRVLGPAGIRCAVTALTPSDYASTNWWQHEDGLLAFQNEVVKYAFYLLKY